MKVRTVIPYQYQFEEIGRNLTVTTDSYRLSDKLLRTLAEVYWPETEVDNAVQLALRLTNGCTGVWRLGDTDLRGLFLLDCIRFPWLQRVNLFDPVVNASHAAHLWSNYGWELWKGREALVADQE